MGSPSSSPRLQDLQNLDDGVPTIIIRRAGGPDPLEQPPKPVTADPPRETAVIEPTAPPPPPSPALERALVKMREVFHLRDLRPGQAEIIESVLAGRDTLAIMPTGSGKSLTYQLPALVLDGPTVVISPLLALIEDQFSKLKAAGVPIVRIDSTRTAKERAADLAAVREGKIKIVMITPESVNTPATQEALAGVKLALFAVDEAHCVSQWGHDFRPAYLGLRRAAEVLGRPPILGLTATATPAIADDVLVQLGMKDPKVCRVSFHRPNLAFDVRKVAGEADKLRQLGKLLTRLRRPGIVYCATVRAVDDLYVALKSAKIPVERYNGKMTTDEREKAQASFMQPGRKVVMLATNAFGLGVDKPDIRYIIHYQMPGSPEAYVQEAGRAGRDGKPARCVLLFQPDDIAIQEHFLKEAHPTKAQARMVAEGLYAWSDEGKEVSVRDLALSMALPERRVRVILSVLEAMGVAEEVKAARWKGVEPKPTREQIDKAAMVFEARRISDRRRLAALLSYMNTQRCRVQMLRAYFGEPEGDKCGLCDSCAGLDSEVFDPGSADERHGLHAATDFHARPRRRRRGRGGYDMPAPPPPVAMPAVPVFETAIPSDLLPPLPMYEVPAPPESEAGFDEALWAATMADGGAASLADGSGATAGAQLGTRPGEPLPGDAVVDPSMEGAAMWLDPAELSAVEASSASDTANAEVPPSTDTALAATPPAADDFEARWLAVRDANIRPYVEWRPGVNVNLPVLPATPNRGNGQAGHNGGHGGHGGGGPGHHHSHHGHPQHQQPQNQHAGYRRAGGGGFGGGGNGGGNGNGGGPNGYGGGGDPGGRRRRRRGRNRHTRDNHRDRGPRLPGFYNPGGD